MGKYDELISEAKVALSDVSLHTYNAESSSNLRLAGAARQLRSDLALLEGVQGPASKGPLARMKEAMFVTAQDVQMDQAAARVRDNLEQVQACLTCRCASCVRIEPRCDCTGCLYGGHTTACDDHSVTREFIEGACDVDGLPLLAMETDRDRLTHIVTLRAASGHPQRFRFNLRSGEKSPLMRPDA